MTVLLRDIRGVVQCTYRWIETFGRPCTSIGDACADDGGARRSHPACRLSSSSSTRRRSAIAAWTIQNRAATRMAYERGQLRLDASAYKIDLRCEEIIRQSILYSPLASINRETAFALARISSHASRRCFVI